VDIARRKPGFFLPSAVGKKARQPAARYAPRQSAAAAFGSVASENEQRETKGFSP